MKRFFYLLAIIAAIGIVILVGYFLRYRSEVNVPPAETPFDGTLPVVVPTGPVTATSGESATATPASALAPLYKQFGLISQNPVIDYAILDDGSTVIIQPDGQITKISGGKPLILSSIVIANILQTSFSADGQKLAVLFGDSQNPEADVFDISTKSWQPLPQGIFDVAWSPKDHVLAYIMKKSGQSLIAVLDLDNSKAKSQTLLQFYADDLTLNWPGDDKIIVSERGSAFVKSSAWILDVGNKTLLPVLEDARGLQAIFEPASGASLVFTTDLGKKGGKLTLKSGDGQTRELSLLTLPSKCTFELQAVTATTTAATSTSAAKNAKTATAPLPPKVFLDCAIPRDLNQLSISSLPDAYYKKAIFTADDFYRVDVKTGELAVIFNESGRNLDASNLKISHNNLFFINRYDQKVYVMPLR